MDIPERVVDECPACGSEFWFWPGYAWGGCRCGLEGKIITDDCPYCDRKVIIVGSQSFCLSCGLDKHVDELREIQISEYEHEHRKFKELMETPPGVK